MPSPDKTTIAIFNYGGGMRGLLPAHFMARLEETTGLPMTDMVDIFAGPSTGAILNSALNRRHPDNPDKPLYRARHMVRFYERDGLKIFPQDRFRDFRGILHDFNNRTLKVDKLNRLMRHGHYDPTDLGRALRALYGETKLADSLRTLIISTYSIDQSRMAINIGSDTPAEGYKAVIDEGGHAIWMKNIRTGCPVNAEKHTPDVTLYDAVMASTAAPTYFPCHSFDMAWNDSRAKQSYAAIDGSIFDNPCINYLGAMRQHVPPDNRLVMLVFGTGFTNKLIKKDDWDRFGALGVVDPVNDLPLINIFFHASESALMDAFGTEMGRNLFVFNKSMLSESNNPMGASTQIDDASPENIEKLRLFFEMIMEENKDKFDDVCHLLVSRRDSREKNKKEQDDRKGLMRFLPFLSD